MTVFVNADRFYDEEGGRISVETLHYVRGVLEDLRINLRKNTAINSLGREKLDVKMRAEILHQSAGKPLVERHRRI